MDKRKTNLITILDTSIRQIHTFILPSPGEPIVWEVPQITANMVKALICIPVHAGPDLNFGPVRVDSIFNIPAKVVLRDGIAIERPHLPGKSVPSIAPLQQNENRCPFHVEGFPTLIPTAEPFPAVPVLAPSIVAQSPGPGSPDATLTMY
jgi:hypothetical protein